LLNKLALTVSQIHLISGIDGRLPFSVEDAARPEAELEAADSQYNRVLLDTRLNGRVVDLRVSCSLSSHSKPGALVYSPDANESSDIHNAVSNRRLVSSVLGKRRFHRDPQPEAPGGGY
jgi:hypothetical protein